MRIGDLIECSNERDLKQTINALELGGFNADRIGMFILERRKNENENYRQIETVARFM